uniref:B3 domain-containing protein Os06g0194400 n=1 Tax=Anthurium amnicola TaxID=1678845 RepID=A0A1D1Y4V5_9ARAE
MVVAQSPYEELRRRKLEENRRKIEELKLTHLSHSLLEEVAAASSKPSPSKPRRRTAPEEGVLVAVRRSKRIKDPVSYKEVQLECLERVRRAYKRDLSDRVYASDEAREYAEEKAIALQSQLASKFPNLIKLMLQSHVTGGFWLGLPKQFCVKHLPRKDTRMTLVDEDGKQSPTLYLAEKTGLSAGWRGFSIDHGLVDGDALVFELVTPTKFKVYIIRQSGYYEADEANGSKKISKR